jgi:hypothetical protein
MRCVQYTPSQTIDKSEYYPMIHRRIFYRVMLDIEMCGEKLRCGSLFQIDYWDINLDYIFNRRKPFRNFVKIVGLR